MNKEIGKQFKQGQEVSFTGMVISESSLIQEVNNNKMMEGYLLQDEQAADRIWKNADEIHYMVDHTSEAFWQMDKDFKFTFTSAACEKISGGFKMEDFVGKSLLEFLTPEGIEQMQQVNGSRQKNELQGIKTDVIFHELQMRRKDGTYFWAGISASPRRDPSGNVIGYQGILRDVSGFKQYEGDRKSLEELLKKEKKMAAVGNIAGSVAHELNNVMAGILGHSELLMIQNDLDNDTFNKHVRNIIDSGERAAAIVQDLLIMSRKTDTNRRRINLNELIPACLKKNEFQKLTECYPGMVLSLDLEPCLHPISASVPQLEKSIMNLLSWSCEQAGPGGAVSIATKTVYLGRPIDGYDNLREGEYVVLSITDGGNGISDDDAGHLFEPFYVRKVMKKGITGLELSVAREVINDHYGFINVSSKIGYGATYTVYLPVVHGETLENYSRMSPMDYTDGPTSIN
jgi:two-component system, cell cycle sensor histidine kinase and response regulator CckA